MDVASRTQERKVHGRGFWLLAAIFPVLMAYSTLPTPIYPTYQRHDGFPTVTITVIFAAYGFGVMGGLFLAGHLSDHLGRRRMIATSIAFALLSAVIFIASPTVPSLLMARLASGIGVGMLTPAATAMLSELRRVARPQEPVTFASTMASSVNTGGLAFGPLLGGMLVEWVPAPMVVPYLLFAVMMTAAAVALAFVPETNPATPAQKRPKYHPQRAVVQEGRTVAFRAARVVAAAAFSVFGVLTSVTGTFLAHTMGETSPLIAGIAVFLFMGASALAQVALPIRHLRAKIAWGLGFILTGLLGVAVSAATHTMALYLCGGFIAGAGVGLLFQAAIAVGSTVSEPDHVGGTVAGIFLAAYIGITVPVIAAGLMTMRLSVSCTLEVFCAIAAAVIAAASTMMLRTSTA